MKLDCKEISISENEFGYTIEFRQEKEKFGVNHIVSVQEIVVSLKPYILLQRTYGQDKFKEDYYYFETKDFDKSGELKYFTIVVYRKQILINHNNEKYEIAINCNDFEFENLKSTLEKLQIKKTSLKFTNRLNRMEQQFVRLIELHLRKF